MFSEPKLTRFVAALHKPGDRAELHDVLWLVLISFALIALWGASDRWDLAGARRRVAETVHIRHESEDARGPE